MKDEIIECEDCDKELKTYKEWKKCFVANHTIRTRGLITIPSEPKDTQEILNQVIAIAVEDIPKGNNMEINLQTGEARRAKHGAD